MNIGFKYVVTFIAYVTCIIWAAIGVLILILTSSPSPPCDSHHHIRTVLGTTYCSDNR